jgi:hypothetical protein
MPLFLKPIAISPNALYSLKIRTDVAKELSLRQLRMNRTYCLRC